jgi:hypothetical protein
MRDNEAREIERFGNHLAIQAVTQTKRPSGIVSNTLVEGGAEYQQVSFQSKIDPRSAYTSPVHSSLTQIRGAPYGTPLLCPFGLR